MARMIYNMLQSLDGFIAGPDGGPQMPMFGEPLHSWFNRQMEDIAASVYGRNMYEIMQAWQTWEQDYPAAEAYENAFARAWRETPKIVVSTTLEHVGPNARLVSSDVEAELRRLKAETEGTIDISGATIAASAAGWGLIDEYQLVIRPAVLGGGKPFFKPGLPRELKLIGSEELPEETVLLRYAPASQS
jgi:dihydrofolate reductase